MTYDIYRYIFIIGAILAAVMLGVSIVMFFVLRIPTVIGDLTGSNARKGIESIRSQTQKSSGGGTYKARTANVKKSSDARSKKLQRYEDGGHNTAKIAQTAPIINETTVLGQTAPQATYPAQPVANETMVLDATYATQAPVYPAAVPMAPPSVPMMFEVEYDITFIHTDEQIA